MRRKNFNKIVQIKKEDGSVAIEEKKIINKVVQFYKKLLSIYHKNSTQVVNKIIQNIPSIITHRQNKALHKKVTKEKVKISLFLMELEKFLGPDGFPSGFFQKLGYYGKEHLVCH